MRRTITIWYKNVYPKPKNILFLFCYKYLLKVEMHKCLTLSSYYLFIYLYEWLFHLYELCLYTMCMPSTGKDQKKVSDALGLKL